MNRFTLLLIAAMQLAWSASSQNPLLIPELLSGTTFNLSLQHGEMSFFPGAPTATMAANGNILGPTLVMQRNEQVTINVTNQLGEETTLHWHGLHVPAMFDGGPHVVIPAGATWSPTFQILDWASTYWYHPHLHEHTNEHVVRGLSGFILVQDEQEAALDLPRTYGVDDIPIVLQTKAFDANNQILHESEMDTCVMANGTVRAVWNAPSQLIRLRLLNGASLRYFNLGFEGNLTFHQIGSDGGLLSEPISMTRLMLAPGERAEILVDLSALQGQAVQLMNYGAAGGLPNGVYGAAQPGMGPGQQIPGYALNPRNGANFPFLTIEVGPPTDSPVADVPVALVNHTPWTTDQADLTRELVFTPVNTGPNAIAGPFVINDQPFDMMTINFEIPLDNIEIWELRNQTPIGHPFHIHHVQFYVLSVNGQAPPANLRGRKDVVHVPGGNAVVRVIAKYETYSDPMFPYMYHCHMLPHEDEGMMGQFRVIANCTVEIETQPQDVAVVTGSSAEFTTSSSAQNAAYQWQSDIGFGFQNLSNAGQYSGVNTPFLTVSVITAQNDNHMFRCRINDMGCEEFTNVATLHVLPEFMSEPAHHPEFQIWPNPAGERVWVSCPVVWSNHTWRLLDFSGRMVSTGTIASDAFSVSLEGLPGGIYFLRIEGEEGAVRRFVHN